MDKPQHQDQAKPSASSNVFDDDQRAHSPEALFHVVDGFRPVSPISSPSSPPLENVRPHARRLASGPAALEALHTAGARASIVKSQEAGGDAGPVEEGSELDDLGVPSENPFDQGGSSSFTRPTSQASVSFDGSQSPYLARVSSFSFSYPRRPRSAASSAFQPAHPYALYQQTSFEEGTGNGSPVTPTVRVGFPGRAQTVQRQLDTHGEELDVLGPDGYAEQLPPYSKYPEEGSTKSSARLAGPHAASPVSPLSSSRPSTTSSPRPDDSPSSSSNPPDPDIGLGQPSIPPSEPIPPSIIDTSPVDLAPNRDSSTSSLAGEKIGKGWSWKEKRNRKVLWGMVPLWSVLMFVLLCIFLAVIVGGIIGGILSSQRIRDRNNPTVTVTNVASMFDASPIPEPTGIPPMPTGTFFFTLGTPVEEQRKCIAPTREVDAWSCGVPNMPLLIEFSHSSYHPTAKLYPAPQPNAMERVQYGPQPPKVQLEQKLIWVSDLAEPDRGPALHLQTIYDKIVVLDSKHFPSPGLQARDASPPPFFPPSPLHHYASTPGEEPWYCYFNATFIEAFIYIQQPIDAWQTQQSAVSRSSPTPTDSLPAATSLAKDSFVTSTSPSLGSHDGASTQQPTRTGAVLARNPSVKSSVSSTTLQSSSTSLPTPYELPSRFPYIIKVEERRLPNPAFTPFCQRMQILEDGTRVPKPDTPENRITLKEATPAKTDAQVTGGVSITGHNRKSPGSNVVDGGIAGHVRREAPLLTAAQWELARHGGGNAYVGKRDEPDNSCHCQWVSPAE